MPLRALAGGREIQVWDLTREEGAGLRRRGLADAGAGLMACRGAPGLAKTSRNGNPFFAHRSGRRGRAVAPCRWAGEPAATRSASCWPPRAPVGRAGPAQEPGAGGASSVILAPSITAAAISPDWSHVATTSGFWSVEVETSPDAPNSAATALTPAPSSRP